MIAKKRRERGRKPHLLRDSAKLLKSAGRRNENTLKYANACSDPQIHQEIHPPLAHLQQEGTGLRAEVTEAEEVAAVLQETASPTLLPTSHQPGPSTNQTSSLIPPTIRNRGALPAQDLLLRETSSLCVSLEVLKDAAASALFLVAPDRAPEFLVGPWNTRLPRPAATM